MFYVTDCYKVCPNKINLSIIFDQFIVATIFVVAAIKQHSTSTKA